MKSTLDPRKIEMPDEQLVAALRALTPAGRLQKSFECNRTARLRLAGRFRTVHPDWTHERINAEVARSLLGGTS